MGKLFEELKEMKAQYDARLKRDGEAAVKEAFKELFDAYPEIRSVVWTQYTPYFNDGDTCEFSVHEFDVNLVPGEDLKNKISVIRTAQIEAASRGDYSKAQSLKKEADKLEARFNSDDDDYQYGETRYELRRSGHPRGEQIAKAVTDLAAELPEDVLESVFGDHVVIVATRQGFNVSEYNHD
jgi:hypothetical protein